MTLLVNNFNLDIDAVTEERAGYKSILGRHWQESIYDHRQYLTLIQKCHLPEIIAKILAIKGIGYESAIDHLNPSLRKFLPDPFDLKDMEKSVEVIYKVIESKEKIAVFGDYDVDGATSSAIIKRFMRSINQDLIIYIPDRISEGYGPSESAFKKLKQQNVNLIITVDCGAMAFEAITYAKNEGMKIVVLDHHLGAEKLPDADAVVNPNRVDEVTIYKNLAAVGVAFLMLVALRRKLCEQNYFIQNNIPIPDLIDLLDLVALGTICDVVRLDNLNRSFVSTGLKVIKNQKNIGLNALIDIAGVKDNISTYHLGFVIGPRINAGGRVGESSLGANILSSDDQLYVKQVAEKLNQYNNERKAIEEKILEEAMALAAEKNKELPLIILASENWHQGVIGIVASRIKEAFNKPTAILSICNGVGKASCRSVPGVDFGASVVKAKNHDLVIIGGGHAMAAGFSVQMDKLDKLEEFFCQEFMLGYKEFAKNKFRFFDVNSTIAGLTLELIEQIHTLGPFGSGNFEPLFLVHNIKFQKIINCSPKHIKLLFSDSFSKQYLNSFMFNYVGTNFEEVFIKNPYKITGVIGYPKINNWLDRKTVEFQIIDIILDS